MKEHFIDILVVLLAIETFFIALALFGLNDRIKELEENNKQAHEYMLNRIGG